MSSFRDATGQTRSIFIACVPTDHEYGFDQIHRVHSILADADLTALAHQLGYRNTTKGVQHLETLRVRRWLGLEEGVGTYDLRYTTVELVLAILKLGAANAEQLERAREQCALVQGHFRQRREDQAFAHIEVVSEHSPWIEVNSFTRALMVNLIMKRQAPSLCDYPHDQILVRVGQQISDHYRKYRDALPSSGRWLGFRYFFNKDSDPIEFNLKGKPVDPILIEAAA